MELPENTMNMLLISVRARINILYLTSASLTFVPTGSLCRCLALALALAMALLFTVTEVTGQLTWVQLHNASFGNVTNSTSQPPARRDAILSYDVIRNQLILFGGSPGPMSDTWIYSVENSKSCWLL